MKIGMKRSATESIEQLREAEVVETQGSAVADVVRKLEVREQALVRVVQRLGRIPKRIPNDDSGADRTGGGEFQTGRRDDRRGVLQPTPLHGNRAAGARLLSRRTSSSAPRRRDRARHPRPACARKSRPRIN